MSVFYVIKYFKSVAQNFDRSLVARYFAKQVWKFPGHFPENVLIKLTNIRRKNKKMGFFMFFFLIISMKVYENTSISIFVGFSRQTFDENEMEGLYNNFRNNDFFLKTIKWISESSYGKNLKELGQRNSLKLMRRILDVPVEFDDQTLQRSSFWWKFRIDLVKLIRNPVNLKH